MVLPLLFFGDSQSDSAEIKLGASIQFYEDNGGVSVATADGITVVPSQSVDITTSLTIVNGSGDATSGVLKVIPSFTAGATGATLSLNEGSEYDVYVNGSLSSSAVMVVYCGDLYFAQKTDNSKLEVFTPTTSTITIKFTIPVQFPSTLGNSASGEKCSISMQGVVLQSTIYSDNGSLVDTTIENFQDYFDQLAPKPFKIIYEEGTQFILFGEYPQSIKSEKVSITSTQADTDGYYLGDDGYRYAKVRAIIYGGSYTNTSTNITMTSGTDYYFKVEPLKWRVLSQANGKKLLLCDSIITSKAFLTTTFLNFDNSKYYVPNGSGGILTDNNGNQVFANNYEYSDIRDFLNDDFYNTAFSDEQKSLIKKTLIDNSIQTTTTDASDYICNNTEDNVFLLSYKDMLNEELGFTSTATASNTRCFKVTHYAIANYAFTSSTDGQTGTYFLRSPSYYSAFVYGVDETGEVKNNFNVDYSLRSCLPALYI